jgi:hypothetical protein
MPDGRVNTDNRAATFEDAKAQFAASWEAFKAGRRGLGFGAYLVQMHARCHQLRIFCRARLCRSWAKTGREQMQQHPNLERALWRDRRRPCSAHGTPQPG